MNMILENPIGLWALAAIGAVLILHRLRQRPERRQVSSLIIWKKLERLLTASPVRKKIWLYLILLLQILAVIGLAIALARPIWRTTQPEPLHLVFLIDNSASMGSVYNENGKITTRWKLMKEKIKGVIDKSPAETTVSLYQAPPLESFIDIKRYEIFNVIDALELMDIPSDVEGLVSLAQGVKGEFYFCSDKLPPDSVMGKLPKKPHLILVGAPFDNRAIIRAAATPTSGKEDNYDVFVSVKNYSSHPANTIMINAISLITESSVKVLWREKINLDAKEKKDLSFKDIPLMGRSRLKISIEGEDGMPCDDEIVLIPPQPCRVSIAGKDNPALVRALKSLPSVSLDSKSEASDITIFNETLPLTLPARAIVINSNTNSKPAHPLWDNQNPPLNPLTFYYFWRYQGVITNSLVTGIDTSSPIIKYCDFNVFNNIPYVQKLLPEEKEYIKPIITAGGTPGQECILLGEWQKGARRLVFLNFPLEWRSQTNPMDWTLTPTFPIFWANLINYLHPVSQDYTIGRGLCNEVESDNSGITVLDTNVPTSEQMPRIETRKVELGHWPIIGAGLLFLLGWILARK